MTSSVGPVQIQYRASRHNARRVQMAVTAVVMGLDVIQADRAGHARHLVQLQHVVPQIRIINQTAQIALEMDNIDRIKANQGSEQAPVGLGQLRASQVALLAQASLQPVQAVKQGMNCCVVGGL